MTSLFTCDKGNLLLDLEDLVLYDADRCLDLNNIADLLAQHSLAERRLVRDLAVHRIGLLRADEVVLLFLVLLEILNNKAAAGRNLVCSVAVAGYNDWRA